MVRPTSAMRQSRRVIFSGIQPTGIPHLGNYAGALSQWNKLQYSEPDSKLIFSVVDLHAITVPQPPGELMRNKREMLAALLAIGIDPERSTLFYQSAVPEHSELMWILSTRASVGYLSRMTQWKDKLSLGEDAKLNGATSQKLKLGLFTYPVLQAADILVHRATHVPVGEDQKQHLEFAREAVTNFNAGYGEHLVPPETIVSPVRRVMSLVDPTCKMSKSAKSEKSRILITDTPEEIRAKISKAVTDSTEGISYDVSQRPGISNLLSILSVFDPEQRTAGQLASVHADLSPKQLKTLVADATIEGLGTIGQRYRELLTAGDEHLDKIAEHGAVKARKSAQETMEIVKQAIGLSNS